MGGWNELILLTNTIKLIQNHLIRILKSHLIHHIILNHTIIDHTSIHLSISLVPMKTIELWRELIELFMEGGCLTPKLIQLP
jgi:hypothetical protein